MSVSSPYSCIDVPFPDGRLCSPSPGVDGQKGLRLQFNSRQSSTVDTSIPFSARHFEYSVKYSAYIPCRQTAHWLRGLLCSQGAGFSVVTAFGGHGIGRRFHTPPMVSYTESYALEGVSTGSRSQSHQGRECFCNTCRPTV